MRVYIAARYKWSVSNDISNVLQSEGIDVFLPKSIDIEVKSIEEQQEVFHKCMHEIVNTCDVFLFVYPFGFSVTAEWGAVSVLKFIGEDKKLILLNLSDEKPTCKPESEDMMNPVIDARFTNISDVVKYLKDLKSNS